MKLMRDGECIKARCLVAQIANPDRNRFFAGTLGLRQENEVNIRLLLADSSSNQNTSLAPSLGF